LREKELKAKISAVAASSGKIKMLSKRCMWYFCCKRYDDPVEEEIKKKEQNVPKRSGKELWAIAKTLVQKESKVNIANQLLIRNR